MSDVLSVKLPRFDVAPVGGLSLKEAQGSTPPESVENGTLVETFSEPEPAVKASDRAAAAELELSEAIRAFGRAIEEIRSESRRHTTEMVGAIASSLFPKLSRLFLAEEIARHLPELIPTGLAGVEIHAGPALAKALQRVSDRTVPLPAQVSIVPVESLQTGQVEITWHTGGFDLDFDALLGKCLAQMNICERQNKE